MRDRRFEPRHVTHQPVELRWTEANGASPVCAGVLRDLSRSGARIESERPLRLQTAVRITLRDREASAQVRSCTRTENGFMLGLELDADCQGLLTLPRRVAAT